MLEIPQGVRGLPVMLQRNSFGPRLIARAADVWRAMQDVVVDESTAKGWPPERYAATNSMFVVRNMEVKHLRELRIGEPLTGYTWVSRARRAMLFTREVRLFTGTELVAAATQEWAFLSRDLQPTKPGPELYEAFPIIEGLPRVELDHPTAKVESSQTHAFRFRTWHTWMDPFAHINHPAYVDFCDEATCRVMASAGLEPQHVVPVSEQVHFRAPLAADVEVLVETTLVGTLESAAVLEHRVLVDGKTCALATTTRALLGNPELPWAKVFSP
jgi:acyl-CoA thioesterase FadM